MSALSRPLTRSYNKPPAGNTRSISQQDTQSTGLSFSRVAKRPYDSDPVRATQEKPPQRSRAMSDNDLYEKYKDSPEKAAILEKYRKGESLETEPEPVTYKSFFFRKDIISNFQDQIKRAVPADKRLAFPLTHYNLYNSDDIFESITSRGTAKTRYQDQSADYLEMKKNVMDKFISRLSREICGTGVGSDYVKTSLRSAIQTKPVAEYDESYKYDILIIADSNFETKALIPEDENEEDEGEEDEENESENKENENKENESEGEIEKMTDDEDEGEEYTTTEEPNSIDKIIDNRIIGVAGFIVVQLGECRKYPFSYTINIICTKNTAISGSGSVLMGAYLYTILYHNEKQGNGIITTPSGRGTIKIIEDGSSHNEDPIYKTIFETTDELIPVSHIATLELANSYTNTGGLCMYEKFGFKYDHSMYSDWNEGISCFDDFLNLPMIINFKTLQGYAELNRESKLQKIINITSGIDKGFAKSLICSVRGPEQKLLGILKTLKIILENSPSMVDEDTSIKIIANIIYYGNPTGRGEPLISRNSYIPTVDRYIAYLETPVEYRPQGINITPLLQRISVGGQKFNKKTKKLNRVRKTKKLRKHHNKQKTKARKN